MSAGSARSLASRLVLASLLLLPLFLGGTGWFLERSYRLSLETAEAERLELQVLTLLAEADFDQSLRMPEQLLEARFNRVDSGLYALVSNSRGEVLWSSPSTVTAELDSAIVPARALPPGDKLFSRNNGLYRYDRSVLWETDDGIEAPLVFTVLETTTVTTAQLDSLRRSLLLWLGGATLGLLALQLLVLLWGLRPLRELAADISSIETGETESLGGPYPAEVQTLTDNLGSLLKVEKQRRERTRNTLSDLAHSLKTPLAVIRSANADSPDYARLVSEQADQMEQIVSYQLQRASGGGHSLMRLISVAAPVCRLQSSLQKVYRDKALRIELRIPEQSQFRGDERDLLEVLGNLLDNACKYCSSRVRVTATGSGADLTITVDDDGDGIPVELRETILQRGARADTFHQGQGIGLAVAADIVNSYGGELLVAESELGGARITISFRS